MRKNNLLYFFLFIALIIAIFSCKKSSTSDSSTTTVIPPNQFNGNISIYSSGNDTTLQRFLAGNYNTIRGSLTLATSDPIDYAKYFVNLEKVMGSVTIYKVPNQDLSFL